MHTTSTDISLNVDRAISQLKGGEYPPGLPTQFARTLEQSASRDWPFEYTCFGALLPVLNTQVFRSEDLSRIANASMKMALSICRLMLQTPEANYTQWESLRSGWYNYLTPERYGRLAYHAAAAAPDEAKRSELTNLARQVLELCERGINLPVEALGDEASTAIASCRRECMKLIHILTVGPLDSELPDRGLVVHASGTTGTSPRSA